jgi:hypothetical protein
MTTITATSATYKLNTATTTTSWKAIIKRAFELCGAPYANSPYMPL